MVGILFENADALEAVRRPVVGQRLEGVGEPAGLDPLVQGEVGHEVALAARPRWGEGTDCKMPSEL